MLRFIYQNLSVVMFFEYSVSSAKKERPKFITDLDFFSRQNCPLMARYFMSAAITHIRIFPCASPKSCATLWVGP